MKLHLQEYLRHLSAGEKVSVIAARHGLTANAVSMALSRAGLPSSQREFAEWVAAGNEVQEPFVGPLPKPRKPKGPQALTLTLSIIHGRCDEVGDCLLWKGAVTNLREGSGSPSARHNNKVTNLRRLVWKLAHPGKTLAADIRVVPTCRQSRCLCEKHQRAMSMPVLAKFLSEAGVYSNPVANAKRIAASRAVAPKLSMEIARAIRAADTIAKTEAEKWGICIGMVYRIRQGVCWSERPGSMPANSVFALGMAA